MLEVPTASYVSRLKSEADKYGVSIPLIMVDQEGDLGHRDAGERKRAVRNHRKWIVIASDLGCHSVRVNWRGYDGGDEMNPVPSRSAIPGHMNVSVVGSREEKVGIQRGFGESGDGADFLRFPLFPLNDRRFGGRREIGTDPLPRVTPVG